MRGVALTAGEVLEDIWAPVFVALVLSFVTGGRLPSRARPAHRRLGVRRRRSSWTSSRCCSSEQPGNVLLVFPSEHRSTAPSTRRSARWRSSSASRPCARDRRPLARGVAAAAAGAAAERRGRRVPADVRLAAGDRPRRRARGRSSMIVRRVLARCSSCRRRSSPGCCARGSPAADSRSSSASSAGCAARRCRRRSARTLGDPTLVLAYRLPERAGYADAEGRPVLVPPVTADRASAPIERDGREVAALVYDASLDDDPEMVEAVLRRRRDGAGERAPPRRVRGPARRGAGVAPADRRGRRRRTPAARARPPRRRPAAARRRSRCSCG